MKGKFKTETKNQLKKEAHRSVTNEKPSANHANRRQFLFAQIRVIRGQHPLDIRAAILHSLAMPIYEFHGEKCGADHEILVRSSDWQGTPCPECGSTRLAKKFSTFASTGSGQESAPLCSGVPSSCGRCGTGQPHSH